MLPRLGHADGAEGRPPGARLDELEGVAVVAGREARLGVVAVVLGVDLLDAVRREQVARGVAGRAGGEAVDPQLVALLVDAAGRQAGLGLREAVRQVARRGRHGLLAALGHVGGPLVAAAPGDDPRGGQRREGPSARHSAGTVWRATRSAPRTSATVSPARAPFRTRLPLVAGRPLVMLATSASPR